MTWSLLPLWVQYYTKNNMWVIQMFEKCNVIALHSYGKNVYCSYSDRVVHLYIILSHGFAQYANRIFFQN